MTVYEAMQIPVSAAHSSALRCNLWLTPMHITPQATATMPTTTKTEMGSWKIATAP